MSEELAAILKSARNAANATMTKDDREMFAPNDDWFREFVDAVADKIDAALHEDGAECPCCGIPT